MYCNCQIYYSIITLTAHIIQKYIDCVMLNIILKDQYNEHWWVRSSSTIISPFCNRQSVNHQLRVRSIVFIQISGRSKHNTLLTRPPDQNLIFLHFKLNTILVFLLEHKNTFILWKIIWRLEDYVYLKSFTPATVHLGD